MKFDQCTVFHNNPEKIASVQKDIDQLPLKGVADMLKAIAEENRTKIVTILSRHGEMCVCDLAVILGLTPANMSSHLRKLYKAGIIKNRREGKLVFYSLDDEHVNQIITMSLAHKEEMQ